MKGYVLTARKYPWLLRPVEDALRGHAHGTLESPSRLMRELRLPNGRPLSPDQILIAMNALCDLGVLERRGSDYRLDRELLDRTEELCKGIYSTLEILRDISPTNAEETYLCVSIPPALPAAAEHVIRECSSDLRSSLLDVIASAKHSLILASPFWDAGTTNEMVSLLNKKISVGVKVWILGRFSKDLSANLRSELRRIADDRECSILSWFEGTGDETQTFHFKAVSADSGTRAYMGSANMTVSSMRSRMELGVILNGVAAVQLDRILRVVITMATPVNP
jgi:phosphatidylserine/phosphatidylglycerophosphate/cardiolipin synthase-like enzyme